MTEVRQRVQVDAHRIERAGSLVMLLGCVLGVLGVLGAAGAAAVSKNEMPVKAAIGLGGLIYAVLMAFGVVVLGLVLRTFGGYVQVRTDEAATPITRNRPPAQATSVSTAGRLGDKKPTRPANAAAASATAQPSRTSAVAVAKPTASGLRPPVKTG